MQQWNYDVVVIGSGIGGLGAAALLADKGYKILVVERINRLGGRMSTDEFEGFKLPTGALAIHRGDEVEAGYRGAGRRAGCQLGLIRFGLGGHAVSVLLCCWHRRANCGRRNSSRGTIGNPHQRSA